ncbi:LuxR C-terminal-related transcriptional regulator [Georgenia sp. AZ-5]|uniref:LuxR C-terminal-related transcriptional regulator n=1 Tax=Georgenia sp. AZ-5 TaxID=3367526 RepID=UPI0037552F04
MSPVDTVPRPGGPSPAARSAVAALRSQAAGRPDERLVVDITGPGGSGKTALLAELAAAYRSGGLEVRGAHDDLQALPARCAVLADDAHELGEDALDWLRELTESGEAHVVVAHRSWPQSPALRRLVAALRRHRAPVVLGPLERPEVSAHLAAALGRPVPTHLAEALVERTGGMPWLVHRTVAALGDVDGARSLPAAAEAQVADQLGHELEHLERDVRRLLAALAVGYDLSGQVLPPVLREVATTDGQDAADDLVDAARASGLLTASGDLIPLVREAMLRTTPAHQLRELQRSLVDALLAEGQPLDDVARVLARTGLKDRRVAQTLERAADGVLPKDPALAGELYDEAAAAGADDLATAARRAQAAALAGDLDAAGRILDDLLTREDAPDLARAVDVAAAVWAQRGMLARSAEVYRWFGPARIGASAPLAAVYMYAVGDREGGDAMLEAAATRGTPTLLAGALALMGQGVRESLAGSPTRALAMLVRASDMMTATGSALPLPDTPAALAALVALDSGDPATAGTVIDAAIEGGQGGAAARPRLLLLRAWVAMVNDRPDQARAAIAEATAGRPLHARDDLLLRALHVGLARRADDAAGLTVAWARARESLLHHPVDLFGLLPLGELLVAAARLRDRDRLQPHIDEAWALLAGLDDAPLWSVPLHWAEIRAAIQADRPGDLAPHAAALVRAAGKNRLAAVLAKAGRAWVTVLAERFDPATVESAARGLAAVGHTWDGSRLAGHAAARAADRKDMARLLACARDLHPGRSAEPLEPAESAARTPDEAGADVSGLSAREREVARLVLAGKTYREIGETIYISPRTAEHHIARIRRRLGATTRSELLDRLRVALGQEEDLTFN